MKVSEAPLRKEKLPRKTDRNDYLLTSFFPQNFKVSVRLIILLLTLIFFGGLLMAVWYFQTQLQKNVGYTLPETLVTPTHVKLLRVGTDPTYPPMEYVQDDKMIGYDIDIANYVLQELGIEAEFKNILFDDLFTSLDKNEIDMIISTVTINEERKQKYDFSEPYLNAGQVIVTRKDNTDIVSTIDLKGKKIGVQTGTTIETEALKYTDDQLVVRYTDFDQTIQALIDNDVDAIFTDLPNAKGLILQKPELKITSDPFTNDYYGIVFSKGDPMVKQVNQALESLRIEGVLADLKQKWLD